MDVIRTNDLLRRIKDSEYKAGERFCFVLGAGASFKSGIKMAGKLAEEMLVGIKEHYGSDEVEFKKWKRSFKIDEEKPETIAKNYSTIFEKRFEGNEAAGYGFLTKQMEDKKPSYGYSVLAHMLSKTKHNVVITTNFDNLIEEAMFIYSDKRPLMLGHEFLAKYYNFIELKPAILKVHNDLKFDPKNTPEGTADLHTDWQHKLLDIFKFCTPIFIGYGGNDGSLMNFLLKDKTLKIRELFWLDLDKKYLNSDVRKVIQKHNGKFLKIEGFDEFMYVLKAYTGYPDLNDYIEKTAKERIEAYQRQEGELRLASQKIEGKSEIKEIVGKEVVDSELKFDDWYDYEIRVENAKTTMEKEKIYLKGLEQFPNSLELNSNYAYFLNVKLERYKDAEVYYKKAIELKPGDTDAHGGYAVLLHEKLGKVKEAETHFLKVLEINPENIRTILNYTEFLILHERFIDALSLINKATLNSSLTKSKSLALYFMQYAFYPKQRKNAKQKLGNLLKSGYTYRGYDFSLLLAAAEKKGGINMTLLKAYADKINGKEG